MLLVKQIKSLIFVDDDPAANYIHKLVLKKLNSHIEPEFFLTANNALTYLSKINHPQRTDPDIIFVDINMPVMDGWDFVREYTNTFFTPQRKQCIIMFSSLITPDDVKKASEYEVIFDLVEKPLSVILLTGVLGNILQTNKDI